MAYCYVNNNMSCIIGFIFLRRELKILPAYIDDFIGNLIGLYYAGLFDFCVVF